VCADKVDGRQLERRCVSRWRNVLRDVETRWTSVPQRSPVNCDDLNVLCRRVCLLYPREFVIYCILASVIVIFSVRGLSFGVMVLVEKPRSL